MHTLVIPRPVQKQLNRIPRQYRDRILIQLQQVQENPRKRGAIKLSGRDNEYRIRVGDYRVRYEIDDERHFVIILHLLPRPRGKASTLGRRRFPSKLFPQCNARHPPVHEYSTSRNNEAETMRSTPMADKRGRDREAREVVRYLRAAEVGKLLLGELDGRMEWIDPRRFITLPRRELRTIRSNVQRQLRGEVDRFCQNNKDMHGD